MATFTGQPSIGGAYDDVYGAGTVLQNHPEWRFRGTLQFAARLPNCTDGAVPFAELVQAANGNFYGTTTWGGANSHGTVFEITPSGVLTVLYSFCSQPNCTDGTESYAGLIQATNGAFYGTTTYGGTNSRCYNVNVRATAGLAGAGHQRTL